MLKENRNKKNKTFLKFNLEELSLITDKTSKQTLHSKALLLAFINKNQNTFKIHCICKQSFSNLQSLQETV